MKIRLWHDVEALGKRGDVVSVKDGYARNYLLPRRMAGKPTVAQDREYLLEKRRWEKRQADLLVEAKAVAEKMQIVVVSVEANANPEGVLFGSVTPHMISAALTQQGFRTEAKSVKLDEPIKKTGDYKIPVRLHADLSVTVEVKVVPSAESVRQAEEAAKEAKAIADAEKARDERRRERKSEGFAPEGGIWADHEADAAEQKAKLREKLGKDKKKRRGGLI